MPLSYLNKIMSVQDLESLAGDGKRNKEDRQNSGFILAILNGQCYNNCAKKQNYVERVL